MTRFNDMEAFLAYFGLVADYWKNMVRHGAKADDYRRIVERFIEKMAEQVDTCFAQEAIEWVDMLESEPFNELVDMESVAKRFTVRVARAVAGASAGKPVDAVEWIRFVDTRKFIYVLKNKAYSWVDECLAGVCDSRVSSEVARAAYGVLEKTAPQDARRSSFCEGLNSLKLPPGKNIWEAGSFREALWACTINAASCAPKIKRCAADIFTMVKDDPHLFGVWVGVCDKFTSEGIGLWGGDEGPLRKAAEYPTAGTSLDGVAHDKTGISSKEITLMYFYSQDVLLCQHQSPIVNRVTGRLPGAVTVRRLDADKRGDRPLFTRFGVKVVPTLIIAGDGLELKRYTGLQGEEALVSELKKIVER
ncbi:MAG: thioredoxin domain-containing protein [Candidatus Omnitrophota bacterium]|nr:thioredoxin domain-containing protein [Candidatus Omnitrophota bacterium]